MLKRFSHITLSFLLLMATTGMAVSKHFCDDFLISTSVYAEAE
ncbi:HYC_CC_PP family protein, partial [Mariniphaga sediminis]